MDIVDGKECVVTDVRGPLVAVDERMIACQPIGEAGRKIGEIALREFASSPRKTTQLGERP
jgi:hypothetical protein